MAGRVAATLSRAARAGSGSAIGGRIALALAPRSLAELGRGRVAAVVSGTNGKTTTTSLLAAALRTRTDVASNESGSNMTSGLVSTLWGARRGASAVLEVDERYLPGTVEACRPKIVTLLNLSRDQLDRSAETLDLARRWRESLARAGRELMVVANSDDPAVAWAALGAHDPVWVGVGQSWSGDSGACPGCGRALRTSPVGPGWSCASCGLRRPRPQAWLDGAVLVHVDGTRVPLRLALPGPANLRNAAMAVVAARELGVPMAAAAAAMTAVDGIAGRYDVRQLAGATCRLLLAKNPAGWVETLALVGPEPRPIVISINGRPVDGVDTSWLYDVQFERLRDREVVVCGRAATDLSVRLGYAGVPHRTAGSPRSAASRFADVTGARVIDVVGDYSGFQEVRRLAGAHARGGRP
jgi:UDP-N-acetylmuramyl tripeptide synthase